MRTRQCVTGIAALCLAVLRVGSLPAWSEPAASDSADSPVASPAREAPEVPVTVSSEATKSPATTELIAPPTTAPTPAVPATQPAAAPADSQTLTPDSEQPPAQRAAAGNPFRYRDLPDEGFVPTYQDSIPAGIQVLAIMVVDGKALAVLHVPGLREGLYVRTGDIISVDATETRAASSAAGGSGSAQSVVYLKIEAVTDQQVILYPQRNPAGRQILR